MLYTFTVGLGLGQQRIPRVVRFEKLLETKQGIMPNHWTAILDSTFCYSIASATSAASSRDARDIQQILEGAAVCIRRANARAELRRARDEVGDSCGALHAARAVISASAP